jgi:hypothetical protein
MPNRFGRHQKHTMGRSLAERAFEARMESARIREERERSRHELGLELRRSCCRHGNEPDGCPLCRDWTAARPVRRHANLAASQPQRWRLSAQALFGGWGAVRPLTFG